MRLDFTKMQSLGNDFVVLDGVRREIHLSPDQIRHIAERHVGVGCDQVLLAEPARQHGVDFALRIFNADGGEVEQCGNGARCFAKFLQSKELTNKEEVVVQTTNGVLRLMLNGVDTVTVDMGIPEFEPSRIPFVADRRCDQYSLDLSATHRVEVTVLSIGNPHAVQLVDDVDGAPVAEVGPLIENHRRFPNRINAGFMEIVNASSIRVRVHERGVGETLACGSGACAAVIAGRCLGYLKETVRAHLPGGELEIRWPGKGHSVLMTGPACTVFEGTLEL